MTSRPPRGGELRAEPFLSRLLSDYGIILALTALCVYFSWATYSEQHLTGADAGEQLARQISAYIPGETPSTALIVARDIREDGEFARKLRDELPTDGTQVIETVLGTPADTRKA